MKSVAELLDELRDWLTAGVNDKADQVAHELMEVLRSNQEDGEVRDDPRQMDLFPTS